MKRFLLLSAVCLAALSLAAQDQPSRPKITGIAHVRLYAADLTAAREFYRQILGLRGGTAGCLGSARPCFTINSRQQIELAQIAGGTPDNLLAEVAFATSDVAQMRRYLLAHGIAVKPMSKDGNGPDHFELLDPEGHPISFVQQSEHFFSPTGDQISARLFHAGFIVKDNAVEDRF